MRPQPFDSYVTGVIFAVFLWAICYECFVYCHAGTKLLTEVGNHLFAFIHIAGCSLGYSMATESGRLRCYLRQSLVRGSGSGCPSMCRVLYGALAAGGCDAWHILRSHSGDVLVGVEHKASIPHRWILPTLSFQIMSTTGSYITLLQALPE